MLLNIHLDMVNVNHDISICDFIMIRLHCKTINDNIELSPSPIEDARFSHKHRNET